jgi:hypothetical protein
MIGTCDVARMLCMVANAAGTNSRLSALHNDCSMRSMRWWLSQWGEHFLQSGSRPDPRDRDRDRDP